MTFRKDAEISSVNSKLESEQALVAQLQKKIKELQASSLIWELHTTAGEAGETDTVSHSFEHDFC